MTPSRSGYVLPRPQCAAAVMLPGPGMVLRARSRGGQRAGMRLCRHEIVPSESRAAAAAVPAGPGPAFKYNRGESAWHSRVA